MMIQIVTGQTRLLYIGQDTGPDGNFDLQSFALFKRSCSRTTLLTVLRGVYAIVRLGSGKTMVLILHVDLIWCRYI